MWGYRIDCPEKIGGGHVGFNISTLTAPQIPYLAQGAVIPANREFLAVLGDQSHGTNVEAPLDTIKQAVPGDGKTVPEACLVRSTPDRSTLYAVQRPDGGL